MLIKSKRVQNKDEKESGLTFMITTATAVREVFIAVSTRKAGKKHTMFSMILRKRKSTTHDDDRDDNNGGDVEGGASAGWEAASNRHTCRTKCSCQ